MYDMLNGSGCIKSANATLLEIEFVNGSRVLFKSTEQQNRGFTVDFLILDECAWLNDDDIFTILPLAQARNAQMIIVSTPFTEEGYFYRMYMIGHDGSNENIKLFDWTKSPDIGRFLTDEKKEFYKKTMSREKYTTEVEGKFLTSDGLLFTNISNCLGVEDNSSVIYIGVDFSNGNGGDYTVVSVMNNNGHLLKQYRTNSQSPTEQIEWIVEIVSTLKKKYEIKTLIGEVNSMGAVYIDSINKKLQGTGIMMYEWNTSNTSKNDIITSLQIAFENEMIRIPDEPTLINELRHYEAVVNPKTKTITYNGHAGFHDDCVMSLAITYNAYKKSLGKFEIRFV